MRWSLGGLSSHTVGGRLESMAGGFVNNESSSGGRGHRGRPTDRTSRRGDGVEAVMSSGDLSSGANSLKFKGFHSRTHLMQEIKKKFIKKSNLCQREQVVISNPRKVNTTHNCRCSIKHPQLHLQTRLVYIKVLSVYLSDL